MRSYFVRRECFENPASARLVTCWLAWLEGTEVGQRRGWYWAGSRDLAQTVTAPFAAQIVASLLNEDSPDYCLELVQTYFDVA